MHGKRKIGNGLMCNISSQIRRNVLRKVAILQSKIEYYCLDIEEGKIIDRMVKYIKRVETHL